MFYDAKFASALEASGEAEAGEGGGGDLGGSGDDFDDGGDEDFGDEGEEAADEPETGDLLSAPAKREPYTTPGSNGKEYTRVATDTRDMGARQRSIKSKWSDETASSSRRNLHKGLSDLVTLSKGIAETTYGNQDEKLLLEVNRELSGREVQNLIDSMEKVKNES